MQDPGTLNTIHCCQTDYLSDHKLCFGQYSVTASDRLDFVVAGIDMQL